MTMEMAPGAVLSEAGLSPREMNVAEHSALLEVLRPLDRLLAVKAARWATDEQRTALRSGALEIRQAAETGDRPRYLELDQLCNQVIVQAARNSFATDALTPLYSHSRRFWCSFSQSPDLRQSAEWHAVLMESVAQGDPDAAGAVSDAFMDFWRPSAGP